MGIYTLEDGTQLTLPGDTPAPRTRQTPVQALKVGADYLKQSFGETVAGLGKGFGLPSVERAGVNISDQAALDSYLNRPSVERIEDIGSFADFGELAQSAVLSNAPTLAALALTRGAGRVAGGRLAAGRAAAAVNRAKDIGGYAGLAAGDLPLQYAEGARELREAGVEDYATPAALAAIPRTALDMAPLELLFRRFGAKKGAGFLRNAGRVAGVQALAEGLTEAAQESIGVATRAGQDKTYDPFGPEAFSRVFNALALGGLTGAAFGGALGGFGPPASPEAATPGTEPGGAPPPAEAATPEIDTNDPEFQRRWAAAVKATQPGIGDLQNRKLAEAQAKADIEAGVLPGAPALPVPDFGQMMSQAPVVPAAGLGQPAAPTPAAPPAATDLDEMLKGLTAPIAPETEQRPVGEIDLFLDATKPAAAAEAPRKETKEAKVKRERAEKETAARASINDPLAPITAEEIKAEYGSLIDLDPTLPPGPLAQELQKPIGIAEETAAQTQRTEREKSLAEDLGKTLGLKGKKPAEQEPPSTAPGDSIFGRALSDSIEIERNPPSPAIPLPGPRGQSAVQKMLEDDNAFLTNSVPVQSPEELTPGTHVMFSYTSSATADPRIYTVRSKTANGDVVLSGPQGGSVLVPAAKVRGSLLVQNEKGMDSQAWVQNRQALSKQLEATGSRWMGVINQAVQNDMSEPELKLLMEQRDAELNEIQRQIQSTKNIEDWINFRDFKLEPDETGATDIPEQMRNEIQDIADEVVQVASGSNDPESVNLYDYIKPEDELDNLFNPWNVMHRYPDTLLMGFMQRYLDYRRDYTVSDQFLKIVERQALKAVQVLRQRRAEAEPIPRQDENFNRAVPEEEIESLNVVPDSQLSLLLGTPALPEGGLPKAPTDIPVVSDNTLDVQETPQEAEYRILRDAVTTGTNPRGAYITDDDAAAIRGFAAMSWQDKEAELKRLRASLTDRHWIVRMFDPRFMPQEEPADPATLLEVHKKQLRDIAKEIAKDTKLSEWIAANKLGVTVVKSKQSDEAGYRKQLEGYVAQYEAGKKNKSLTAKQMNLLERQAILAADAFANEFTESSAIMEKLERSAIKPRYNEFISNGTPILEEVFDTKEKADARRDQLEEKYFSMPFFTSNGRQALLKPKFIVSDGETNSPIRFTLERKLRLLEQEMNYKRNESQIKEQRAYNKGRATPAFTYNARGERIRDPEHIPAPPGSQKELKALVDQYINAKAAGRGKESAGLAERAMAAAKELAYLSSQGQLELPFNMVAGSVRGAKEVLKLNKATRAAQRNPKKNLNTLAQVVAKYETILKLPATELLNGQDSKNSGLIKDKYASELMALYNRAQQMSEELEVSVADTFNLALLDELGIDTAETREARAAMKGQALPKSVISPESKSLFTTVTTIPRSIARKKTKITNPLHAAHMRHRLLFSQEILSENRNGLIKELAQLDEKIARHGTVQELMRARDALFHLEQEKTSIQIAMESAMGVGPARRRQESLRDDRDKAQRQVDVLQKRLDTAKEKGTKYEGMAEDKKSLMILKRRAQGLDTRLRNLDKQIAKLQQDKLDDLAGVDKNIARVKQSLLYYSRRDAELTNLVERRNAVIAQMEGRPLNVRGTEIQKVAGVKQAKAATAISKNMKKMMFGLSEKIGSASLEDVEQAYTAVFSEQFGTPDAPANPLLEMPEGISSLADRNLYSSALGRMLSIEMSMRNLLIDTTKRTNPIAQVKRRVADLLGRLSDAELNDISKDNKKLDDYISMVYTRKQVKEFKEARTATENLMLMFDYIRKQAVAELATRNLTDSLYRAKAAAGPVTVRDRWNSRDRTSYIKLRKSLVSKNNKQFMEKIVENDAIGLGGIIATYNNALFRARSQPLQGISNQYINNMERLATLAVNELRYRTERPDLEQSGAIAKATKIKELRKNEYRSKIAQEASERLAQKTSDVEEFNEMQRLEAVKNAAEKAAGTAAPEPFVKLDPAQVRALNRTEFAEWRNEMLMPGQQRERVRRGKKIERERIYAMRDKETGVADTTKDLLTQQRSEMQRPNSAAIEKAAMRKRRNSVFEGVGRRHDSVMAIAAEVMRMLGVSTKVGFAPSLGVDRTTGNRVFGWANSAANIMMIALDARNGWSQAGHEVYHIAEDRVMDKYERSIVESALRPGSRLRLEVERKLVEYGGFEAAEQLRLEDAEARAYAFQLYRDGVLQPKGTVERIFRKVLAFLERVANMVRGRGFKNWEDVFAALNAGEMAHRTHKQPNKEVIRFSNFDGDINSATNEQESAISKAVYELGDKVSRLPGIPKGFKGRTLTDWLRKAWNNTVGSFSNLAKTSPGARAVYDLVRKMEKRAMSIMYDSSGTIDSWLHASREQVEKAGKALQDGDRENKVYDDVQLKKKGLSPTEIEMYKSARQMLDTLILAKAQAEAALYTRHGADDSAQQAVANAERLVQEGYVPRYRYGGHVVYITSKTNPDAKFGYSAFNSAARAEQFADQLRQQMSTQPFGSDLDIQVYEGETSKLMQPGLDVAQFIEHLDSYGVKLEPSARRRMIRDLAKTVESARNFQKRLDVAGESTDIMRVLYDYMFGSSHAIASIEYTKPINDAYYKHDWKSEGAQGMTNRSMTSEMINYVRSRGAYDSNSEFVSDMRGAATLMMLGGNLSGGIVQLTQTMMATIPYLSRWAGYAGSNALALKAFKDTAHPMFGNRQSLLRAVGGKAGMGNLSADEVALLLEANRNGTTQAQYIFSVMGIAKGELLAKSKGYRKFSEGWMKPFTYAEEVNRRTALIAAYRMAKRLQKQGKPLQDVDNNGQVLRTFTDAKEFAQFVVDETQFDYSKANRPKWARGDMGAILLTFKSFPIFMLQLLAHMDNKQRTIMLGTLFLMGGLSALPGADDIEDLMDTLGQTTDFAPLVNSRKTVDETMDALLSHVGVTDGGDYFTRGVLGSAFGIDLSSRIGLGDIVPATDAFTAGKPFGEALEDVLGPVGGMFGGGRDSITAILRGDVEKAGRVAPIVGLRNAIIGGEALLDGEFENIKNERTAPASTSEALLKAIGFNPMDLWREQQTAQLARKSSNYINTRRREILSEMVEAEREGDRARLQELQGWVDDWNKTRKNRPEQQMNIKPSDVKRAVKEAGKTTSERSLARLNETQRSGFNQLPALQ